MKLRFIVVSAVAVLAVLGAAMADQTPKRIAAGDKFIPTPQGGSGEKPMGDTIVQIAAVTQQVAQFASIAAITGPPVNQTEERRAGVSAKAAKKPADAGKLVAKPRDKTDGKAPRPERLAAADPNPMLVRCVGRIETGRAAWYGGHYIGQRTSSGDRLDTIRPTAAHRTLPLNSLARVTNLQNGRSVIVKVTDRGPVSPSLLIDMSPRAAEQLAMKDAGVVPVKVEQVVEVAPAAK
ncbi:MAG TPA: septal ring lytic transglycosylase RlpA family protein [Stellaceae bacterium]|nr:septal ring lytic transglycosylase RlpA family protein [Stellaceae bacterium]